LQPDDRIIWPAPTFGDLLGLLVAALAPAERIAAIVIRIRTLRHRPYCAFIVEFLFSFQHIIYALSASR